MNDIKQVLSANIKKFRAEIGLSQAKLAEKANISTNYISMIELKQKFPSPDVIGRLADALNIDASEMFSPQNYVEISLKKFQRRILRDINSDLSASLSQLMDKIEKEIEQTIKKTIHNHLNELENNGYI